MFVQRFFWLRGSALRCMKRCEVASTCFIEAMRNKDENIHEGFFPGVRHVCGSGSSLSYEGFKAASSSASEYER